MKVYEQAILTHGGTSSNPEESDGPQKAGKIGMNLMRKGESALDAVVHAVRYLEDDPRFNAGIGSQLRADGRTFQMDASCMSSNGKFGAVACVERIHNPVEIAHGVLVKSDYILMAGEGALIFAKEQNIPLRLLSDLDEKQLQPNNPETPACDTVGAIAFDGTTFAAALSSGGLRKSHLGRVGDVPLPGCGLYCGPLGAIACTGDGEFIALKILAREVYGWLEQGIRPEDAVQKAIVLFDDSVDVGLIVLTKNEFASASRDGMAWSQLTEVNS